MRYGIFASSTDELQALHRVAVENGALFTASRIRTELMRRALMLGCGHLNDNSTALVA